MTNTHDPLAWIDEALANLERRDLRRQQAVRQGKQSAHITIDGDQLINFGSNDYLGLAADERLVAAARAAAEREGWGSGASPLVSGRGESQAELERRLAEFEGTEVALVFPSGFAANTGVIPALVDKGDVVFADAKNHASLIDGCRLAKAKRFVYPHADCEALEEWLKEAGSFHRRLIVTDTLFSMDGDIAPVQRLVELAHKYDAMLLVDEAHATGVFGPNGRGVCECVESRSLPLPPGEGRGEGVLGTSIAGHPHPNPLPKGEGTKTAAPGISHPASSSVIRIGTLSKALGSGGGFVCGSQRLIDWLANRARSYVFSTAQPPATSAAAIAALEVVKKEPQRREALLERAANLRKRLREQGWNIGSSASQIIPLIVGDPAHTMRLAAALREAGLFVPGIRPPTVPKGESLLRISLCYHHTPELIEKLVAVLDRVRLSKRV